MKNEDQPIVRKRQPMEIRTIVAATCAAIAIAVAAVAHDGLRNRT